VDPKSWNVKLSKRVYSRKESIEDEKTKRIYISVEGKNLFTDFDREQNDSSSLS
jgi:hypothetical protein